jgi:pyrophosphatase PpaX
LPTGKAIEFIPKKRLDCFSFAILYIIFGMQTNYSTVLFDFDGTLTSSLVLWLEAFHYAFAKFELKYADDVIIRRCFYRTFEDVTAEFNLPNSKHFGQMVMEGLAISFEGAELILGVQQVLAECANKNIKLAVVTSSTRTIVDKSLKNMKIYSYFETIITSEDISNYKPHPEPVLLALKRLGSEAESSIIIGDSEADILAGQAAGIKTGLFFPNEHTIFYDFEALKGTTPHFIFHHYDELHQHLFGLSKQA